MCRSEEKHCKSVKTENTLTKSNHKCNAQGLNTIAMNSKSNKLVNHLYSQPVSHV